MTWIRPGYIEKAPKSALPNTISPSSIDILEPVVAQGEIVFAGEDPTIDIVLSVSQTINFTLGLGS